VRYASAILSISTCDILVSIDQLGSMWTKRIVWEYANAISCAIICEAVTTKMHEVLARLYMKC
jgi:hypothetical protein